MSISKNMLVAAHDIIDGVFFEYDVGKFNENYFVYVAAFGMFTDVSYETPQDRKNIFGHAAYIAEGLRRLPTYKGIDITVEHDGVSESGNFLLGLVSNSTSIAGMRFLVSDNVYFDDGLFEVTLVRTPANPIALQQTLNDAIMNRLNTKNFLSFKTSKVVFRSADPISWTLDGESGGAHTESVVENCCRAIKLVIKEGDKTDQQAQIDSMAASENIYAPRSVIFEDQRDIEK
jgi:diacylglycerol kinase family enzyme